MTRKEAIEYFKHHIELYCVTGICREAEEMAIKALEQKPCDNAISRQAVDELSKALVHTTRDKADFLCNFWEGLRKLLPVTPQPKIGQWIDTEFEKLRECSICHARWGIYSIEEFDYCPSCGAKMFEPQESEE